MKTRVQINSAAIEKGLKPLQMLSERQSHALKGVAISVMNKTTALPQGEAIGVMNKATALPQGEAIGVMNKTTALPQSVDIAVMDKTTSLPQSVDIAVMDKTTSLPQSEAIARTDMALALTFRSGNGNKSPDSQVALATLQRKVNLRAVIPVALLLLLTIIGCQKKPMNATIETSKGTIEVELYESDAPKTVANFVGLAEKGLYNGLIFHRVAKGFVIQGGDPSGNGTGGKSIYGKEFEDELNPSTPSYQAGYLKGVLAMANRGPNTNTSQFFIMLRDIPSLPKNYTIFGKVVKGLDVVDSIGAVDITPQMGPNDGKPKVDVVMKKVTVAK